MLQEMIHHQKDQLAIVQEEIPSPNSAQIFEFCESELFQENLQNSDVTSCSNCCYEEASYPNTNYSLASDHIDKIHSNSQDSICDTNTTKHALTATTSNLSTIFDSPEEVGNDISASIDFSPSPTFPASLQQQMPSAHVQDQQYDFFSLQAQVQLSDASPSATQQYPPEHQVSNPLVGPPLMPVYEEDCMTSMPTYVRLNPSSPSCSVLDSTMGFLPGNMGTHQMPADPTVMYSGSTVLLGSELHNQELDSPGLFCQDTMTHAFNPQDLQAISSEGQQIVSGGVGNTDITGLEDPTYKVGKLSVEQRREKIHRYLKKRNERNFSKKIKYACRKTLADSRPRVRGRFAKNDELDLSRANGSNHEEEDEDEIGVKEEEDDMGDSTTNIYAHISGVNSFNCNYPIQSWI